MKDFETYKSSSKEIAYLSLDKNLMNMKIF